MSRRSVSTRLRLVLVLVVFFFVVVVALVAMRLLGVPKLACEPPPHGAQSDLVISEVLIFITEMSSGASHRVGERDHEEESG